MEQQAKKNFIINFIFTAIICSLIFFIGKFTLQYLTPFIIAVVIAYIMQKPAYRLSKKVKLKKEYTALLLSFSVYILFAGAAAFVIYGFFVFFSETVSRLPSLLKGISEIFSDFSLHLNGLLDGLSPEIADEAIAVMRETAEGMAVKISGSFSSFAASMVKKTPSFLFSSIVALVASCYIAKDFDRLKKFIIGIIGNNAYIKSKKIKEIFSGSILKLLKGYLILCSITFLELTAGLLILRVKYAPVIALIIAVVDLLPVLGSGTVLIPWGIICIAFGDTAKGFLLLILYIVIIIARNFLEPKIIGRQIGINPIFTLFAMFAGLRLLGVFGLFLFPIILIVTIKYYEQEVSTDN